MHSCVHSRCLRGHEIFESGPKRHSGSRVDPGKTIVDPCSATNGRATAGATGNGHCLLHVDIAHFTPSCAVCTFSPLYFVDVLEHTVLDTPLPQAKPSGAQVFACLSSSRRGSAGKSGTRPSLEAGREGPTSITSPARR